MGDRSPIPQAHGPSRRRESGSSALSQALPARDAVRSARPGVRPPVALLYISAACLVISALAYLIGPSLTDSSLVAHIVGYAFATLGTVTPAAFFVVETARRSSDSSFVTYAWLSRMGRAGLMATVFVPAVSLAALHAWPIAREWSKT